MDSNTYSMDPHIVQLYNRREKLRLKALGYGVLTVGILYFIRKPYTLCAEREIYINKGLLWVSWGSALCSGYNSLQNVCKSTTTSKRINFKHIGYMKYSSWCNDENDL